MIHSENKIIWLVSEYSTPQATALGRYHTFAKYLQKNGYLVYVIVGSSQNREDGHYISSDGPLMKKMKIGDVKYIVVKRLVYRSSVERVLGSLYFQNNIWRLRKSLPEPYAIVSSLTGLFGNVAFKWKKRFGTKVFFDVFDFWPEEFVQTGQIGKNNPATRIMYKLEHKSYRNADGIFFCVEGGKNYIIDKGWDLNSGGDVDISNTKYINNGTDLDYLDKQKKTELIEDDDLLSDCFKVVYVGAMNAVNDLDILVESAKRLQEKSVKVTFLVYGDGTTREQLQKKAHEYGLKNILFKGRLESRFAPYVISKCDLCFWNFTDFPLLKYGISNNKFFLYVSCGKPILATFKADYDLLESRKCGKIVNKTPEELAEGIIDFMNMPKDEYEDYCRNSRSVAEEYDYKKTVNNLIDLIGH